MWKKWVDNKNKKIGKRKYEETQKFKNFKIKKMNLIKKKKQTLIKKFVEYCDEKCLTKRKICNKI